MVKRDLLGIALTAALYFLAGKLALLLAIPPGYATAIWPSAGIALVMLLFNGYRLWPGVLLGSLLVNFDLLAFQNQTWPDFYPSMWLPLVIGIGASLQAVAGVWLLRRFITYPLELDTVHSVWRFIVIVCGLGCVIGATIGTAALWVAGKLATENYWFNWFTWWVGDGLGVMIFSILLFVFYAQPREVWRSRSKILPAVLLGTTLVNLCFYITASRWELSRQQANFQGRSEQVFQRAQSRIDAHLATLFAVRGLFAASNDVSQSDFRVFAEDILARNPGFQALAWNAYVAGSDRQLVEIAMSAEHQTPVFVTRRENNGEMVLQGNKTDYVVIRYIEPFAANASALGYDIASADRPREALMRAASNNSPAVTDPIRLVQESGDQQGVVIYLPVMQQTEDGKSRLLGYVSGVFRVDDLMGFLLTPSLLQGVAVSVFEPHGTQIYRSEAPARSGSESLFNEQSVLQVADRQWQFHTSANQTFLVGTRSIMPWAILTGGLLFTGLLGMTFLVLTGQKHRSDVVGSELKRMLSQLQETQKYLVEAEKMASLGGLVAGFAHELNTPLGIAITAESTLNADLQHLVEMVPSIAESTETAALLQRLQDASRIVLANIQRAGGLITSFKQVSVDQATAETRDINLHEYLSDVFVHLSPVYRRSGHEVVLECPSIISLRTVPGGLAQVVINLLNNSLIHAFPEGEHGRISMVVTQRKSSIHIVFSDDGVGMAAEQAEKIFEPFFTTNRGSGGTGLGLHLVYNIVLQQLRGQIKVVTQPGCGMQFEIELPLAINVFVTPENNLS